MYLHSVNSQQSFSVLSLALTTQALNLVTSLFEDAIVENVDTSAVLPASLNILANSTASERIAKIFEVADGLIHFFFVISPIIYRKVVDHFFILSYLVPVFGFYYNSSFMFDFVSIRAVR